MPNASRQMRRNTAISDSLTSPSARIMRNSSSSSADSTGIVGDLAHAGIALEQRYHIIEQSLQHAFPHRTDAIAQAYRETRLAQAGCVRSGGCEDLIAARRSVFLRQLPARLLRPMASGTWPISASQDSPAWRLADADAAASPARLSRCRARRRAHRRRRPPHAGLTSRTADERTGGRAVLQVREFPAGRRLQVPRRLQCHRRASPDAQRGAASSPSRPATTPRRSPMPGSCRASPTVIVRCRTDAPAMKVAATQGYGGEVVFYDRYTEDREAIGRKLAAERGLTLHPALRPPGRHRRPGHGRQGADRGGRPARLLLVCLGGGGLLSGCALAAEALLARAARSIGVEPEAGNDGAAFVPDGRRSSTSRCRARSPTAR